MDQGNPARRLGSTTGSPRTRLRLGVNDTEIAIELDGDCVVLGIRHEGAVAEARLYDWQVRCLLEALSVAVRQTERR